MLPFKRDPCAKQKLQILLSSVSLQPAALIPATVMTGVCQTSSLTLSATLLSISPSYRHFWSYFYLRSDKSTFIYCLHRWVYFPPVLLVAADTANTEPESLTLWKLHWTGPKSPSHIYTLTFQLLVLVYLRICIIYRMNYR